MGAKDAWSVTRSVVPALPGYFVVGRYVLPDAGTPRHWAEAVVAWCIEIEACEGEDLTLTCTIPVTTDHNANDAEQSILRPDGSVYDAKEQAVYESLDKWLAAKPATP